MMIPITRKEKYINEIVGGGDTAPKAPQTREEFFFADILGEVIAPSPVTRVEKYLSAIAGQYSGDLPTPTTRIEYFLAKAAGMEIETPTPITREEIFWSNYTVIVDFEVEGVPPLTYKAIEGTLENYKIYGNTVGGESVGDLIENGEHAGEYKVSVTVSNGTDTLTTPIYLSVQIRKVGDEAEYVDFNQQKQHRVRKNLFDEINGVVTDEYIQDNGTININPNGDKYICNRINVLPNTTYTFSWGKMVLGTNDYPPYIRVAQYDSNGNFISRILAKANDFPNNRWVTTAKNDVRLWDIRIDDVSSTHGQHLEEIMLNIGTTALPYEPYIENTDLDVTLPALPTIKGTNVLSVGTAVQPSKVYVKYKGERQ